LLVLAAAACGAEGKTTANDDRILGELATCKEERDKVKGSLKTCTDKFAALNQESGGGDAGPEELVVRVENEQLTIVGRQRGGKPLPNGGGGAVALTDEEQAVTESVTSLIRASKSAIERCYVQALKANEDLENRAITLDIKVLVSPDGRVSHPSLSPRVSQQFDACMKTVASKWKVKAYKGKAFPIVVPIRLQPAP
jgi:hypothetical protein